MELSGTITATELAEIFQLLTTSRKEGTLTVSDGKRKKSIYFSRDGVTLLFEKDKRARSLGELLVDYGRISDEQLQEALEQHQSTGKRLGEVVQEMGLVSAEGIEDLIRTQIEEEIFDLLSWRGGTFQFRDEPPPEILADTEHSYTSLLFDPNSLLMEAARRMDEWERIGELIRTEREVFGRVEGVEPEVEQGMAGAGERVLPLVDATRTAAELLREARLPKFEVYSVLYQLYESGALELVPPKELSQRAVEAIEAGELTQGVRLLESAVAQAPVNLDFAKNLGKAYDVTGDRERALEVYGRVVRGYLERGAPGEAESVLARMRELAPETSLVLSLEVSAALALGDTDEAVRRCLALLRAAERERTYVQAKGVVEMVLAAAPGDTDLREAVADMLARMGERRRAVEEYEYLARRYISRGRSYYARGIYQRILELDPLHQEARRQVEALGPEFGSRRRKALLRLGVAALVAGVVVGAWLLFGRTAVDGGKPPEHGGPTDPSVNGEHFADSPEGRAVRARHLGRKAERLASEGKLSLARKEWQQAAALTPDPVAAEEYRDQADQLRRLLGEARRQLNQAQALEEQGDYQGARRKYLELCAHHDFVVAEFALALPVPVSTVPKGAQVLVDDQPVGTTPMVLRLPPYKPFTVALRSPNHEPWSRTLTSDTVAAVEEVLLRKPYWSRRFISGLVAGPGAGVEQVYLVGADGTVHALRSADGGESWRVHLGVQTTAPPVLAGQVLLLAGRDGVLYGLEAATGEERWRFRAGDAIKGMPGHAQSLGLVFFGALDKNLYGLEVETGRERWHFATGGNVEASPALRGGTVLCGSLDGKFYAVEAETGRLLWRCEAGGPVATAAAVTDDLVCFANLRGEVLACSLDSGEVRWRYRSQKRLVTGVHLAAASVCFAADGGVLVGLDRTSGGLLWRTQGPRRVTSLGSAGDHLWVGGADGSLACLDGKTGEVVWQAQLEGAVDLPIAVGEERLCAATSRGVWCFPR
ncbi:MAG: PQQ-binding-like beta-propeller repeat protein [Planctomycetes bacterium]|nr:PQQ-binding-like beta-propeller repeat protein [Planctomycetota bacterium]